MIEEDEIDGGEDGEVRILLKKAKLDDLLEEYAQNKGVDKKQVESADEEANTFIFVFLMGIFCAFLAVVYTAFFFLNSSKI